MIHINLVQALAKQIKFCEANAWYKCGVFVRTEEQRDIVTRCITNLLPSCVQRRSSNHESRFWWDNESVITVLQVNDYIRGHRFNGAIIENEIDRDIVNYLIKPYLRERADSTGHRIEEFSSVTIRVFTVDINNSDVIESQNHPIYISTEWQRNMLSRRLRNSNIFIDDLNEESFKKENKNMFDNYIAVGKESDLFKKEYQNMFDNHIPVYRTAQVGTDTIYVYDAIGIPRENIKYETEFVNRTKKTYLNIKGEYKNEAIGFGNEINVHLLIDTDVYDKYEVEFHDGLVLVVLHEIINEKPVLEDVSGERGE